MHAGPRPVQTEVNATRILLRGPDGHLHLMWKALANGSHSFSSPPGLTATRVRRKRTGVLVGDTISNAAPGLPGTPGPRSAIGSRCPAIQVMPARLRRRVEALGAMTVPASWGSAAQASVDPGILTTVALACRDSERLRFSYTAADGQHTGRHVEPHRLVLLGHRWYLAGYDLGRHDWRSFRLDRLTAPRGTGTRFRPRKLPAA